MTARRSLYNSLVPRPLFIMCLGGEIRLLFLCFEWEKDFSVFSVLGREKNLGSTFM